MELSKLKENEIRVNELLLETNQLQLQQRFYEKALFEERLNRLRLVCDYISIPVKGVAIISY